MKVGAAAAVRVRPLRQVEGLPANAAAVLETKGSIKL